MEERNANRPGHGPDRYSIRAVDRALDVLTIFTSGSKERSIAELAADTGLGKATTHRIVRTLEARGFLERRANGRYSLGKMLPTLGMHVIEGWTLASLITPTLRELVEKTEETAFCSVLDGDEVLTVASVAGPHRLRVNIVPGERAPAAITADGKVLLAGLPRERAVELARSAAPAGADAQAWLSRLLQELATIARCEVGYDLGIAEETLRTVAVPIADAHQRIVGSIGISGPTPRMTKARLTEMAKTLKSSRPVIPSSPSIDSTLYTTDRSSNPRNAAKGEG